MRHAPILIALVVATAARADGDRKLHLVVHGSVDSAVLGESIAKELGVDVAVVDGACDVPCLDVSVDGKRNATVVYAPRSGSTRSRTVKLGTNTSQWPLVITLLAGNVVRDEARAVLAELPRDLPRPPAASEVPDPAAPPPEAPAAPAVGKCPAVPPPSEAPAGPGPSHEGPEGEGPSGEGPEGEGPSGEGPTGEGPTDEAPSGEGPAGEGPATSCPPVEGPVGPPPMEVMPPLPPPVSSLQTGETRETGEHSFLALGLVPGLSTDLTHIGSVRHFVSLDLLVGVAGGSSGLSLSGIADIERGLVAGFQIAGIVTTARRLAGFQAAGIAAVSGDVDGVQIAGTAAVADLVEGIQGAGIAAVAHRSAGSQVAGIAVFTGGNTTIQGSGIASVARGNAGLQGSGIASVAQGNAGFQVGGITAFAGRDANVQASGITSVARETANIQVAGVVNYARRLRGLQIAPINVARDVDGIQIGVINYGGSANGFSFGLINIVPGGRYDLEGAVDSNRVGTVLFRHGGRRWHNVYGIGGHPVKDTGEPGTHDDVWMYGLGFGPTLDFGNFVLDLEAIGWQVNHGPSHETDISILGQLRLSIAHHWGPFAIVAGGILNCYVTNDPLSPLAIERRRDGGQMEPGTTLTTWPTAFVGVRI